MAYSVRGWSTWPRGPARVTKVERPWGEVFTPDDLKAALAQARPKVVGIVMAETSTGACQPIEEISTHRA